MTLRELLLEDGRPIDGGFTRCLNPGHEDQHPSMHVFDDDRGGHAFCFKCGYRITAYEYLTEQRGFGKRRALEELGLARSTVQTHSETRSKPPAQPPEKRTPPAGACTSRALPDGVLERHKRRVDATHRIPPALSGRGFELEDIDQLLLAEAEDGDGLFPILGPAGELLNIKRRRFHKRDGQRYNYEVAGNHAPAWCSPNTLEADRLLIIEGELNGMAAWLAVPELAVMGTAGASGCLHREILAFRNVALYADPDEAGQHATRRWEGAARAAGAHSITLIPPWTDGDACDVAGKLSRDHLRRRILATLKDAQ